MSRGQRARRKAGRLQQAVGGGDNVTFDPEVVDEVKELFNKVRTYAKPPRGEWRLPDPAATLRHPPQEHARLQALKASLNAVKNQLSDKDLEVWHQHTNSTNRAGKVIAAVRSAANAEICTQAWCKFCEILGSFSLLRPEALQSGELNTVHLCEAPGAFVTALNHYLKTSEHTRYCDWSWAANTLNPYHEANGGGTAIVDDRLIANTLLWWFFGSDNTGDITSQTHLLELQRFVGNMRAVDVVTADGSFDCQENPDEQESLVASLHLCEATAALLLLGPGGSFVLKMFTLYEHSSVCLLFLLNCCFGSVSVFKPATSKAGNSEVYVVCLRYDGKEAARPLLAKLIRNYGPHLADGEALFPATLLPRSFLEEHEEVCCYFHSLQVETIRENLRWSAGLSAEQRRRLELVRDHAAQEYLQRFQVLPLPRSHWLSRQTVSPACRVTAGRPLGRQQTGSFNERRALRALSWRERVERGPHAASVRDHCSEGPGPALEGPLEGGVDPCCVVVGAALRAVRNSAFCDAALLGHLNDALAAGRPPPPCPACPPVHAGDILSEVAGACAEDGASRRCLVFGSVSVWGSEARLGGLVVSTEPSCALLGRAELHDGEPGYQRRLLGCVLRSLHTLAAGDALLLPLASALSRVSAGLVLCLHRCFRSVSFTRAPPPDPAAALLVCLGFCPEAGAPLLPALAHLHGLMGRLAQDDPPQDATPQSPAPQDAPLQGPAPQDAPLQSPSPQDAPLQGPSLQGPSPQGPSPQDAPPQGPSPQGPSPQGPQQVLQFVPMEDLLRRPLLDFLCAMNSAIVRQRLHHHMTAS